MSLLHLRGVQMMLEKIKLQKYFKIRKGTSYLPHSPLLRCFKKNWDLIWLEYCLNDSITLKRCSNHA